MNTFESVQEKMQSEKYKQYFKDFEWPWYMPTKEEYEKTVITSILRKHCSQMELVLKHSIGGKKHN